MRRPGGAAGLVDVGGPEGRRTRSSVLRSQLPASAGEAAADVDALIAAIPAPVGSCSRALSRCCRRSRYRGRRVELALRELGTPQKFLEFHRKIYAGRGVIDGNRALAVAHPAIGSRPAMKIIDAANAHSVTPRR